MPILLIIDDHLLLLESLRLVLEGEYNILAARSVGQALRIMDQQMPDVILVDYIMPYLTGLDFMRLMQGRFQNPPKVIFVSGMLSHQLEAQALGAGAAACLAKPFEVEELKILLTRILRK